MQTDKNIIDGIRNNNERTIRHLYKSELGRIRKTVYSFRSTLLDPDDVFQEGLTRLIMNVKAGKFESKSSISSYLNGICRNICLKTLAKNKEIAQDLTDVIQEEETDNYYENLATINEVKKEIGDKCQKIIDLRFRQAPGISTEKKLTGFEEIAKTLGLETNNARQRFKRCLDKLRELALQQSVL